MRKLLYSLAIGFLLLTVSCKKEDVQTPYEKSAIKTDITQQTNSGSHGGCHGNDHNPPSGTY